MKKVNIPQHWWLPTQEEYVAGCYEYYKVNGIVVGDPSEGRWEDAHYPAPECLGGIDTVLLLTEHHATQGVIQSEEVSHPCVYGWERKYLPVEYLPLFDKWHTIKSHLGGQRSRELCGKRILITHADGTTDVALSLQHACEILKTTTANVRRAISKQSNTNTLTVAFESLHTPSYWDDSNPSKPKPVLIHYPDGTTTYAESIKQASRIANVSQSTVQRKILQSINKQLNRDNTYTCVRL